MYNVYILKIFMIIMIRKEELKSKTKDELYDMLFDEKLLNNDVSLVRNEMYRRNRNK